MTEKFANDASSTLASSITNVASTLTVSSASSFPTGGNFRIRIDNEIMLVTGVSGTTFTVTRGVESTTAAAHSAGASIKHVLTAASLLQIMSDYNISDVFANRPAAGVTGRMFYPQDASWITHCRDNGTSWDNFHHGFLLSAPPTSGWSWYNQGSGTVTNEKDSIFFQSNDTTNQTSRFYYRALPSPPYNITVGIVRALWGGSQQDGVNQEVGWQQSSDGSYTTITAYTDATDDSNKLNIYNFNGSTVYQSTVYGRNGGAGPVCVPSGPIMWYQLSDDNTNRLFKVSFDGVNFYTMASVTRTTFITPDRFIFGGRHGGSETRLVHYKVT